MSEILINPLTQTPVSDTDIASITELAREQYRLEKKILQLEEETKKTKEQLRKLEMELIPARMECVGMQDFTLKGDGVVAKITVAPFYAAHISEENQISAFDWLRKNKHAGIIKTKIACNYSAREDGQAKRLISILRRNHIPFDKADSVHWQTLRAWVKQMKESGKYIPDELFGVYVGKIAKLKVIYEENKNSGNS